VIPLRLSLVDIGGRRGGENICDGCLGKKKVSQSWRKLTDLLFDQFPFAEEEC
jgi:hypothetical protein